MIQLSSSKMYLPVDVEHQLNVQLPIMKYRYNYSVEFKDYTLLINDMKYYNAFFNYYYLPTNTSSLKHELFLPPSLAFLKKRTIANISFIKKMFQGVNYDAVWALVTNSIHFPRHYIEIFICIKIIRIQMKNIKPWHYISFNSNCIHIVFIS